MSQAKICQQCGTQIDIGAKFCPYCGFNNTSTSPGDAPGGSQQPPDHLSDQMLERAAAGLPASSGPPSGQQERPLPQKRPVRMIVLVVLVLAFIAGGALVYNKLNPGDYDPAQPVGGDSLVGQLLDSIRGESSQDLSTPEAYLPAPGLQMTFYETYMDGGEGPLELITADIIPNAIVSDAAMFTDGDGIIYGGVCHYYKKTDGGIYYVFDEEPTLSYPVLPGIIQPGVSWIYSSEYGDVVYSIKQLGASCTLDCGTLTDCLVIEQDNKVFGTREAAYYAPGLGLVLRQSIPDGANLYRLSSYSQIDSNEARDVIATYSINHEQINQQLSGQQHH